MPVDGQLLDERLGRRIIAETRLARSERRVETAINKALAVHEERAILAVQTQTLTAAGAPPDAFDQAAWDSTVAELIEPIISDVLIDYSSWVADFLQLTPEQRALILGEIDISATLEQFLANITGMGPVSATRINEALAEGVAHGEGVPKLTKRVREAFGVSKRKGATIARTETHGAAEATTYASAGAIQLGGLKLNKIWLATNDGRCRKSHKAADGQTVPFDETFHVGSARGDHPGRMGSAKEDVNCRCSMVFEPIEEDEPSAPVNSVVPKPKINTAKKQAPPPKSIAEEVVSPSPPKPVQSEPMSLADISKGKVGLSAVNSDTIEAFRPKSSWTAGSAAKRRAEMEAQPGGKELVETITKFQDGQTDKTRATVEKYLRGGKLTKKEQTTAQTLLDAIDQTPSDWIPKKLYRGLVIRNEGTAKQIAEGLQEGGVLDFNVSGFSSNSAVSREFSAADKTKKEVSVFIEWDADLATPGLNTRKAFPIQNNSEREDYFREKEWLAGGRFYINETKVSGNTVTLRVSQIRSLE